MSSKPLIIWLLTDAKPGHLNQLRGLALRLTALVSAQCHVIDIRQIPISLFALFRGLNPAPDLPNPDLIVAAGSGTQRALLASKRYFAKPAVLLMRPNFPYAWLDAAIVPEHDNPPVRDNVLPTQGVLNAVQPNTSPTNTHQGLLLIGGPSQHYGWEEADLISQIQTLCAEAPDIRWLLSDSRRTPSSFLRCLKALNIHNLACVSHSDTEAGWLPAQVAQSAWVWVTPDSVSMVYEALTSGAPTGLLSLPKPRAGRIQKGLQKLLEEGRLVSFEHREQQPLHGAPLWEANRAAEWLIDRFFRDDNS